MTTQPLKPPTKPAPSSGSRAATGWLLFYASFSSAAITWITQSNVTKGLGNFEALFLSFVFIAFLMNVLFAYQWKAAPWAKILVGGISLLVIMPLAGIANGYLFELALQIGIYAALALGLNIVVGQAGLLDLGYVAFFAAGAYVWAIFGSSQIGTILGNQALINSNGLGGGYFWLFLFVGIGVAALMGILIGLPVLKLKGDYLAIVTLGLGEVIRVLANNLTPLTNGPMGISGIKRPDTSWIDGLRETMGLSISQFPLLVMYLIVLGAIAIVIVVNIRLENSRIGRAWIAIREDEIAAQAMGIPLVKAKLLAFAAGASFAGLMGVIFAAKQAFVSPESFTFFASIGVLTMVILGGMGNFAGVILGAAVVTLLNLSVLKGVSEAMKGLNLPAELDPAKYERLLFGVILILMMIFRPEGLLPAKRKLVAAHIDEPKDELPTTPSPSSSTPKGGK
jgi:branched-chain amino acid transport system permease protein